MAPVSGPPQTLSNPVSETHGAPGGSLALPERPANDKLALPECPASDKLALPEQPANDKNVAFMSLSRQGCGIHVVR
jgi:hypothetical protein